jgi:hypothetical protein
MFFPKINFIYFFIDLTSIYFIQWICLFKLFLKDYVHLRYIKCFYSVKILIMILHLWKSKVNIGPTFHTSIFFFMFQEVSEDLEMSWREILYLCLIALGMY